ncbi:MAG: NAD(P)H-binding protein [Rubrivivax sp.]|nr:NAD(P)H-binding protein [Rubrivivax sp.]
MPSAQPSESPAPRGEPLPGLLIAGASGLVGRELVRLASADTAWHPLHLVARRALPVPQGSQLIVAAFDRLPPLPPAASACCALGTTLATAGSREAFRAVDFDAVLAFARAARAAGVRRLAVVSALGADPRSRNFYNRVKGEAEAALDELGFETLILARPSLLSGDRASLAQAPRRGEGLALTLTRPLSGLIPMAWRPIEASTVARALLRALRDRGPGRHVLESAALQASGILPRR